MMLTAGPSSTWGAQTATSPSIGTTVAGATYTLDVAVFDRNDTSLQGTWQIDLLDNGVSAAFKTVAHLGSMGWFNAETSFVRQ